jgi:ribonuclease HI
MKEVTIITDGACTGNPGPGGWAAVLRYGAHERVLTGGATLTTNNRMEVQAAVEGLHALKQPCRVTLITDSQYLSNAVEKGWLQNWVDHGWLTSNKKPVKNVDLWQELLLLLERHNVRFTWVRGHNNHPDNERCDALARAEAKKWSQAKS